MDSRPDSALTLLTSIDPSSLHGRKNRARWSLDRTMALDKCWKDTAAVEIIGPAERFYRWFPDREKRLLTYYYKGRLLENARRNHEALRALARAETFARPSDSLSRVRIAAAQGRIFTDERIPDLAEAAYRKGLGFSAFGSRDRETLVLSLAGLLTASQQFSRADSLLQNLPSVSPENLSWKQDVAARLVFHNPADSVRYAAEWAGVRAASPEAVPWKTRCRLLLLDGKAGAAGALLDGIDPDTLALQERLGWWQLRRQAFLAEGNLEQANEAYDCYLCILESLDKATARNRARLLEEEQAMHRSLLRKQQFVAGGAGIGGLIVLGLCLGLRKSRRNTRRQQKALTALREEYDALVQVQASEEARNEEFRKKLDQRIIALRPYIADDFPDELYDSAELRHMVDDSKTLLRSVGLLMGIYHPRFVIELEKHRLSELEIGYCGLFALGFTGKEIPDKLRRDSFYRTSQAIRRKVGLGPHDTNLAIWIRNLFNETKAPPGPVLPAHPSPAPPYSGPAGTGKGLP